MPGRARLLVLAVALLLLFSGCGDDDGAATTVTTAATTTQATSAPTTSTTEAPTPTPAAEMSAAEALAPFFAEAESLDTTIRNAAALYNETFDPESGTTDPEVAKLVMGINTLYIARMIPGGLDPDLEVAALAVYADLDSRIAALVGSIERLGDLACLGFGAESAAQFEADLDRAKILAESSPPVPMLAADSPEKGIVMVRATYINGSNTCCDACGGYFYDRQIEVDWEGRILAPGFINAPFEATFDGERWQIEFPLAG